MNRKDWEELHERLNGGVPVPKERQLPLWGVMGCVSTPLCLVVFFSILFGGIKTENLHLGEPRMQRVPRPEAGLLHGRHLFDLLILDDFVHIECPKAPLLHPLFPLFFDICP